MGKSNIARTVKPVPGEVRWWWYVSRHTGDIRRMECYRRTSGKVWWGAYGEKNNGWLLACEGVEIHPTKQVAVAFLRDYCSERIKMYSLWLDRHKS